VVCLREWVIPEWTVPLEVIQEMMVHLEGILLEEVQDLEAILRGEAYLVEVTILPTTKVQILLEVHPEGTVGEAVQISLGDCPEEATGEAEGTPEEAELTQLEQSCTARHSPRPVSSGHHRHFKGTAEAKTNWPRKGPPHGPLKWVTIPAGNRPGE